MRIQFKIVAILFFLFGPFSWAHSASHHTDLQLRIDRTLEAATQPAFAQRLASMGPNVPTKEFGNLINQIKFNLENDRTVLEKIEKDPALKSLHIQIVNHLQHVSFSFEFRDKGYPHDLALEGPYPYKPTLAALERAKEFFQIMYEQGIPPVADKARDLNRESQLLEEQKKIVQKIISASQPTYHELNQRLKNQGLQAPFPEFASLVEYLDLKLQTDELVSKHSQTNKTIANFRSLAHSHLKKVKDKRLPYFQTLDAIQRTLEFFDIVHRVNDPSRSPKLYHSGRYGYYTHFLEGESPHHIMMPTLVSLGATDILKVRGVPIGFIGVNTDVTWVDGYYQTPYEFYVHDINHTRRMWQFFKEHARDIGMSPENFAKKSDTFVKQHLIPLITILKTDDDRAKNLKRLRKVLLFEILHEDALPAAAEVIEKAVLRPPNLLTPFEEINRNNTVTYVMEPGATTLAYVYRKLAHDFYDKPSERINYIVSPEYRNREFIIEAAEDVFKALGLSINHQLLKEYTFTDEGFPKDFKATLEKDIAARPHETIPLINTKQVLTKSLEKLIQQSASSLTKLNFDPKKGATPTIKNFFHNGNGLTVNLEIEQNGTKIDYQVQIAQTHLSIDKSIGTVNQIKGIKRVIQIESGPDMDLTSLQKDFFAHLDSSQYWIVVKAIDPKAESILKLAQQSGFESIAIDSATNPANKISETATFYAMTVDSTELDKTWASLVTNDAENKAQHLNLNFNKIGKKKLSSIAKGINSSRLKVQQEFTSNLQNRGISVVEGAQLSTQVLKGRTPILFSGASKKSWPLISPANQEDVRQTIQKTLANLDPTNIVIVTGATDFGVEKIVHDEAKKRGFTVLGTAVESTNAQEIGAVTHLTPVGISWFGKSRPVLEFIKKNKGSVIFIGGGDILKDEIKMALQLEVPIHLMKGPEGAAREFSQTLPLRSFTGANDLLLKLKLKQRLQGQALRCEIIFTK